MKMKCKQCGVEFESKRVDAKFCSGKCRTASYEKYQEQAGEAVPQPSFSQPTTMEEWEPYLMKGEIGPVGQVGPLGHQGEPGPSGQEPENVSSRSDKPLLTGRATPGLFYPGWTRPKYWMRLRDLPESERAEFHAFLKGRNCPVDPTLPTEEQDFYHPWAYSEWKNPPHPDYKSGKADMTKDPSVPMTIPAGESPEQIKERLKRIKSYNETMEPRHHLSESKLRSILKAGGYNPNLARTVYT